MPTTHEKYQTMCALLREMFELRELYPLTGSKKQLEQHTKVENHLRIMASEETAKGRVNG